MNRTLRQPLTAVALAALLGLAACGNTARIDQAGTVSHPVTVIKLQDPDGADPYSAYFAQDVARRSHGTLRVVLDFGSYRNSNLGNEARLVAALRAGRVGYSYQAARSWAVAGVAGFQALDSPFLVTTVQATEKLVTGPVAGALLRQLAPLGLVGLGLIPNEPRQFLSTRPLIAPADFAGARLHVIDNPQTAALVQAIGARPVQGVPFAQVGSMLRSGALVGMETSPRYILSNFYYEEASYLTASGFFPKLDTIVATKTAWQKLTAAQQAAMRQAAADTLAYADRTLASREQHDLAELCVGGLVLDEPSPAQLAALAHATAGAAPAGAQATAITQMIKTDVPGTGPQPSAVTPPPQCRTASTTAQAMALHDLKAPSGSAPRGATIPPGTYVTTDTVADFQSVGVSGRDWSKPITWTWHLYRNGTFYQTQQPDYPDQPFVRGRYIVKGDEVTFKSPTLSDKSETVRWSYYDGQLTFRIVSVGDAAGRIVYTAHPWRKVG
jgi:TRAP-type C4-dicarboxylate transport system substrate-binding protein